VQTFRKRRADLSATAGLSCFCIAVGLWKVAVVTGACEPQRIDDSQDQGTAATGDSQKETDVTGDKSNNQQKATAVDQRPDNRDDRHAEQQPLKPENDAGEENTNNNAKSQNESEEQVEEARREVPFPPTCRLVMVLYGDQGKTQPLFFGDNESVSEIKFLPGIADKFIVSHYINKLLANAYTLAAAAAAAAAAKRESKVRHQLTLRDHGYGASVSRGVPVYSPAFAGTHCAYPRRDGQAELTWVTGYILRWFTRLRTVTHPSTNRARRRVTSLITTNASTTPRHHLTS